MKTTFGIYVARICLVSSNSLMLNILQKRYHGNQILKNSKNCTDFSYTQKYKNFGFIRLQLRYQCLKQQKSMLRTYQFKTRCKDDISRCLWNSKKLGLLFEPVICTAFWQVEHYPLPIDSLTTVLHAVTCRYCSEVGAAVYLRPCTIVFDHAILIRPYTAVLWMARHYHTLQFEWNGLSS